MPATLTGAQTGALIDALARTFPSYAQLQMMLFRQLSERLAEITAPAGLQEVVFNLVVWAEGRGLLDDLIAAAVAAAPRSPWLRAIAVEVAVSSPTATLEAIVQRHVPMPDVVDWRTCMERCERAICRLEAPEGDPVGSGFLVADKLVLTNMHVAEILHDRGAAGAVARFAHRTGGDPAETTALGLAAHWLGPSSPVEGLDYAFLHLAAAPQVRPIPRPAARRVGAQEVHLILHYPSGAPMKLSAGVVTGTSADPARINYAINTEPGSSGAPVFRLDWSLAALHHAGGPDTNAGVPVDAIVAEPQAAAAWGAR